VEGVVQINVRLPNPLPTGSVATLIIVRADNIAVRTSASIAVHD